MVNQGMYREGGVAAFGLPLPRARLVPLTIVIGVAALAAIVMSLVLLGVIGGGAAGAWMTFKNGGGAMWLILLSDFVAPVALGVLGAFFVRGKRVPPGILFICAAIPFALALLGAWLGQMMITGAISGESVDPEQKSRILAQGIAETMSTDMFGGLVACGASIVACIAASSSAASIDATLASRGDPPPSKLGAIGAGVCGGLWIVVTIGLSLVRTKDAGGMILLPILPLFALVPFAVLAGRNAGVVRAWHDRAEGSRVAAGIFVAGMCAVLATLALQRAAEAHFASRALEAISGESIDPSQRFAILTYAVEAGRLAPVSYAVHAVLGPLTFALALAPAVGGGKHPATPSAIIAVVFGLVLLGGALAIGRFRVSVPRSFEAAAQASAPSGVTLPTVVEAFSDKRSGGGYGARVVVTKDGGAGSEGASSTAGAERLTIYADKAATVTMVRARLPKDKSSRVTFVALRDHPQEVVERIGYLAGYLGRIRYVAATVEDDPWVTRSDTMRVVSVADDTVEIDGKRYTFPLPESEAEEAGRSERKTVVRYVFRPGDSVERAMRTIMEVEKLKERQLSSYDLERVIVVDDGTKPKGLPEGGGGIGLGNFGFGGVPGSADGKGAPTVRAGATSVNGRLPPEVIQRIVRQNFGRLRLCYENGLRKDPKLAGRVSVKFVIDRSGSVTNAADGGSDLPDAAVVSCVVRAFSSLSFPQPEGGIVTVVYPIVFSPGS